MQLNPADQQRPSMMPRPPHPTPHTKSPNPAFQCTTPAQLHSGAQIKLRGPIPNRTQLHTLPSSLALIRQRNERMILSSLTERAAIRASSLLSSAEIPRLAILKESRVDAGDLDVLHGYSGESVSGCGTIGALTMGIRTWYRSRNRLDQWTAQR
jgi:hypothetical protein